nr:retrotransposon protein, putative, Ty1-copia subclass [Tanacetum cinerariifolium]
MTTTVVNNSLFRSFEKQKLTGNNFMEWYRNINIVFSTEDKLPFLEQPIPILPVPPQGQANPPDADQELLQTVREFHACKQEEGQSVSSYVLKMKSYIDNLERLGHAMARDLSVSLILVSLRKEYDSFVQTYNMHSMGKTVNELHAMLKLHEQTLPPKEVAPALHAIRAGRIQKNQKKKSHKAVKGNQGKGKAKMGYAPVQAPPFAPKPKNPSTPKKDNPAKGAICHQCGEVGHWRRNCPIYLSELMKKKKLSQGASTSGSRKLKPGALSLYVGDGHRAAVEAIGDFHLAKLNLDSALLWHCRLGHINKKRIEKLQHDGLLDSTHIKSFEKYVACMFGKMARKPYSHQVKRAKDLLGLIHTDVCGPFKIMSRQEAYYFVTFIDDFSRYGYVYLLKHKHEVFETLKIFQKEVKNQLGKTIKSLRSDRRGEYISQEFSDHLMDHEIIAHRTPLYTPQHNGVSERRNKTLLDMVRSMMSQTTLPKSFWDYALESATRILNMVPTKKVDKTPYENGLINHEASGSLDDLEIIQDEDTHPSLDTNLNHEEDDQEIDEPQSDINLIRRSTMTRRLTHRLCLYVDAEEHELWDLGEPELVVLPPNGKVVGHKWLFKKKTDMDGAVHTYKARLVAKGFTQTPRIDYEETFSPVVAVVADIRAIRILIDVTTFYDYEIWQMDVKTAFLNGYLNEEKFGFSQNRDEPCVYVKASGSYVTFLILYVDDILIMGNNIPMLQDVKSYLGRCFAMKDLGEAAYILEIKIYRDRSKRLIGLCDAHWTAVKNILKYLRNTKDMFLVYGGDTKRELRVSCYTDVAGYLTDDDMKCQTGYVFVLNGGAVDWKSTKQNVANYQYSATPPPKWELLETGSRFRKLYVRNTVLVTNEEPRGGDAWLRGYENPLPTLPVIFFLTATTIQQLIRGFLWCNGELKRGKAKVTWDVICLPKKEGGLGIRSLEVFDIALMTTHIWNIVTNKESLWVHWIHMYKLKGRTIWDVPVKADMSWGWLKLLQIRDIVKPFFWTIIGNGKSTSVWYDSWCPQSPLNRYLTPRDISREGFSIKNCVADLVVDNNWIWPQAWLLKAPDLGLIAAPILDVNRPDVHQWKASNGKILAFSVSCAWEELRPRSLEVSWSLKTQDMLRQWDVGMDLVAPNLQDIISFLQPMAYKRTATSIIGRLLVAASSYFIWLERNNRLFKKVRRSVDEIRDIIMVTVRLKLLTFRFKNTAMVRHLLSHWKMPTNFRLYGC